MTNQMYSGTERKSSKQQFLSEVRGWGYTGKGAGGEEGLLYKQGVGKEIMNGVRR